VKFGMTDQQFALLHSLVIEPLKSKGAKVFIFGSRVRGKHHSHSDVDLLFRQQKKIELSFISNILEQIEESKFPFKIDLVEEKDVVESYKDNPNLKN